MATVAELGAKVKATYPGTYDDLSDVEVGVKAKAKYPDAYGDFADMPAGTTGPQMAPYSGTPDEPGNMNPPWWANPNDIPAALSGAPGLRIGQAAMGPVAGPLSAGLEAAGAPIGAAIKGAVARAPEVIPALVRGSGGALTEMGMEMLPAPIRIALRGAMAAGRSAGSAASRVAPEAAAAPAAEAAPAAAQAVGHVLNPEEAKVVLDASRRRGFATLKEAGIQGDKAVNGFIKKALGRKIGSKADLNVSDWLQINKAADEAVLEAKAAIQAAARAGKATVAKVVTKAAKPVVGAAASRVPAASEVPPGTLQRLSEMNLSPQQLYDFWRQAGAQ
jgi:hypothetical protein